MCPSGMGERPLLPGKGATGPPSDSAQRPWKAKSYTNTIFLEERKPYKTVFLTTWSLFLFSSVSQILPLIYLG